MNPELIRSGAGDLAVVDPVGGVVGVDLVDHRRHGRVAVVGLTLVEARLPAVDVGARVAADRRLEALGREPLDVGLLHHPDAAEVAGVLDVVEVVAVRRERVGELAPGDVRGRDGEAHRRPLGALPGNQRAVEQHRPVLQRGHLERHAAAVGAAGGGDLVRIDQPLVDELAEQQLRVADLVADVHQVDVAFRASGRVGVARLLGAAGLSEAALAQRIDGVALVEEVLHRLEAELRAAVAVVDPDDRVGSAAGAREREVDVERNAVERLRRAARVVEVRAQGRPGGAGIERAAPGLAERTGHRVVTGADVGHRAAVDVAAEDRRRRGGDGRWCRDQRDEDSQQQRQLPQGLSLSWSRVRPLGARRQEPNAGGTALCRFGSRRFSAVPGSRRPPHRRRRPSVPR